MAVARRTPSFSTYKSLNVTLTGQLLLIELIARLAEDGAKIVYANTDEFKSLDNLLSYVKIETGCADIIEANGIAFRVPKSIAFASMREDEFNFFYNSAVDICMKLVPIDRDDLAEQISKF